MRIVDSCFYLKSEPKLILHLLATISLIFRQTKALFEIFDMKDIQKFLIHDILQDIKHTAEIVAWEAHQYTGCY